jgi:hypothetical protein
MARAVSSALSQRAIGVKSAGAFFITLLFELILLDRATQGFHRIVG